MTFSFSLGPNATTFIIPSELFPTSWRSTCHGFCAAMGKLGAIVGSFGFLYASQPKKGAITYSYPCTHTSDLTSTGLCARVNLCPTGRKAPSSALHTHCDICVPHVLSGCYPFGIGKRC